MNSTVHSDSEQIEVRIGRSSSPRPAVMLGESTRIITPLMGATPTLLSVEVEAMSAQVVDLVEWGVDLLLATLEPASDRRAAVEEAWEEAVSQAPLPVLATIRTTAKDDAVEPNASEYAELVTLLAGLANAIDVEIAKAGAHSLIIRAHEAGAIVIASFHDFNETPPDDTLATFHTQVAEMGVDILKVACRVTTPEDALRVLTTQIGAHHEHRRPIIDIDIGEAGAITRIVDTPLFSAATFAFVAASSAPGQFIVEETRRGLNLVGKKRAVEKRKSDGEEETVDKARGHRKGSQSKRKAQSKGGGHAAEGAKKLRKPREPQTHHTTEDQPHNWRQEVMMIHKQGPSVPEQIDSRPLSRQRKSLIGFVIISSISEFFDTFLIGFVVSLLTKPWDLSGIQTGVILACSGLGALISVIGALIVAFSARVGSPARGWFSSTVSSSQ